VYSDIALFEIECAFILGFAADVVTGKIDVRHLAPSGASEDLEKATDVL